MAEASAVSELSGEALGRYVTVAFAALPGGVSCSVLEEDERRLHLQPLTRLDPTPVPGEQVTCLGNLGRWTTTAVASRRGRLELATPRWRTRSTHRRWPRVPLAAPVTLDVPIGPFAGRIEDATRHGAAVLVERAVGLRVGDAVRVEVPGGAIEATVRSVRAHAHPLLVVLGLAFERTDKVALHWLGDLIAAAVRPVTAPPGAARSLVSRVSAPRGAPPSS